MRTTIPTNPQDYSNLFGIGQSGMDQELQPNPRSRTAKRERAEIQEQNSVPVRTAMQLMSEGYAGQALTNELVSRVGHKEIQASTHALKQVRAQYEGLIGRVVHDPAWFDNCNLANRALTANKEKDPDIVIRRMAKCATCTLRAGTKCSLMKKQLVSKLEPVAQQLVQVRVASAVRNREISTQVGLKLLSINTTATNKLKYLHKHKQDQGEFSQRSERQASTEFARTIQPHSNIDTVFNTKRSRIAYSKCGPVTSADMGNTHSDIIDQPVKNTGSLYDAPEAQKRMSHISTITAAALTHLSKHPITSSYWQGEGRIWANKTAATIKSYVDHGQQTTYKDKQVYQTLRKLATAMPCEVD